MYDVQNSFTYVATTGVKEQTITASAASTNVLNFGNAGNFFKPAYVHVRVTEAFESGTGGATLTIDVQSDSTAAFGSAATFESILAATDHANLTKGTHIVKPLNLQSMEQFLRMYFTVSAAMTTGKIVAYINDSPEL